VARLRPSTRLRLALRAARRRRYGYAALRVLRRGLRDAVADHVARSIGPARYASELDDIRALYRRGLRDLLRRFGRLDLADERARLPVPSWEPPRVEPVGNLHDLLREVCA
jgi:hypothetical protein